MPTQTQTPDQDELNPAKDVGQANIDDIVNKRFNPDPEKRAAGDPSDPRGEGSDSLHDRETQAAGDPSDPRGVAQREDEGDSNWDTKVTANPEKSAPQKLQSFFGKRKRRGILGFMALAVAIIGIIGSLMSGAMGLVNLKETAISKLTQRADSVMTHRMNRVMIKKMSQDLTAGCKVIKVKCRYKGMSTREVKKFNKRNMGNGVRVVTEPSIIPGRQKVVAIGTYELENGATVGKDGSIAGKTIKSYKANEIKTAFKKDPKIYKAAVTFFKSPVQYHSGNVARGMFKRIGVNLGKKSVKDGKGSSPSEKLRNQQNALINTANATTSEEFNGAAKSKVDDLPDEVKDGIDQRAEELKAESEDPSGRVRSLDPSDPSYEDRVKPISDKIEKSGGGVSGFFNPFRFLLPYCTLRILVQATNQVRKVNQTVQLIKFAAIYLTLADQIKAGDADGEAANSINAAMSILMAQNKDGLSGFDSMGYNWISRGSVRSGYGEDITKFQNGGSASGLLGGAVSATTGGMGGFCKVASSRWATLGFVLLDAGGVALSIMSGGLAAPAVVAAKEGIKEGGEVAIKKSVENIVEKKVTKYVIDKMAERSAQNAGKSRGGIAFEQISKRFGMYTATTVLMLYGTGPLIETLARSGSKTVTKDLVGPDSGNAFYAGIGAENAKAGQAQGLQPITADEAVKQDKAATSGSLANAKTEGINQLDVGNPYSFSSKFAQAILPSITNFGSVSAVGSNLAGIYSTAFGSLSQNAYAADNEKAQYEYCLDEAYLSAKTPVATDPFCNPQFGFEPDIVNGSAYDPEKVADYVYDNGLVDAEGEPTGEFEDFIKKCMESETTIGQNGDGEVEDDCVSREDKFRAMRIYCLDSSIDSDMKEEIANNCSTQDVESSSAAQSSDGTEVSGSAQELAQEILDNDKISLTCRHCKEDIQNTADGKPAYGDVTIDINILKFLADLGQNTNVAVNAITGEGSGHTSSTSNHYAGKAVDLNCSMTDGDLMDQTGEKYGIKSNDERCDAGIDHWHYSVGGG